MGNQDSSTRSHDGSLELQEGPWYGGGLGWLLHSDRFADLAVQRWWVSVMINGSQWWPMGEWSPGTPFQYLAAWPEGSECTGQVGNSTNYSELFRNVSNTNKGLQHGILTCGNSWLLYPKSCRKGTSQFKRVWEWTLAHAEQSPTHSVHVLVAENRASLVPLLEEIPSNRGSGLKSI